MRIAVAAAVACLSLIGLSATVDAQASVKQFTNIPAQGLGAALQSLAQERKFHVVYASEEINPISTLGAVGDLTQDEALQRLLSGTGLTYRYLNKTTVTVYPADAARAMDGTAGTQSGGEAAGAGAISLAEQRIRIAQADSPRSVSDPSSDGLEEVTVRGKPFTDANVDIVRTEDDAQAYYIFSSEQITKANTVNLEEFLRQRVTMNTAAGSYGQNNSGFQGRANSRVNLRGLGFDQTLILVNGRRATGSNDVGPVGANDVSQFDLNVFPPSMIERIEVLPSSGSAIYGGNAVGGVINVILKRDFTGGDFRISYDTPLDKNAPTRTVSGGYGWSLEGGRTNVTLNASYQDSDPLTWGNRQEIASRISRVIDRAPGLLYSANFPSWYGGTTPNIAAPK